MKKTIKDYKSELRFMRNDLNFYTKAHTDAQKELDHYRRFVRDKFEWYVELHGQNKYPKMTQLIIDHAIFFNKRKPFDFGMLPRAF